MADHLIDEVDEALRRERLESFWKRFGQYVIAGSLVILLLTIGGVIWQNYRESQRQEWSSAMLEALELLKKNPEEVMPDLTKAEAAGKDELLTLTHLWQAQTKLKLKDTKAAQTLLDPMKGGDIYQEYGLLLSQATGGQKPEAAQYGFDYTSRELAAMDALEKNDMDTARVLLTSLAEDALTPQTMRERAALMLTRLGSVNVTHEPAQE